MLLILLGLILSFSSFGASLSDCLISIVDAYVSNYSYPRDSVYVSIIYPDGHFLGYDPTAGKFVGYREMKVIKLISKKGEDPAWPLFENQKDEKYVYVSPKGLRIIKYPPTEDVDGYKYLTAYDIDCAEGKNVLRVISKEPAIVEWEFTVEYEEWEKLDELIQIYFYDRPLVPDGMYRTFILTPTMGQREFVFYVDRDYRKVRIEAKVSPEMLIEDLKGCADLGLIKNYGVLNSLFSKLQNADRLYRLGRLKEAQNIIKAFGHELSAQKGKHIDEQCVFAVQTDVDFFMGVNIVQEGLKRYLIENR